MGYHSTVSGELKISPLKLKKFQLIWDSLEALQDQDKPAWYNWFFSEEGGSGDYRILIDCLREGANIEFDENHGGRMYEFEDFMKFLTPFVEDAYVQTCGEDDCVTSYEVTGGKLSITFSEVDDLEGEVDVEEYDAERHESVCEECEENAATHGDKCYDCALECTSDRRVRVNQNQAMQYLPVPTCLSTYTLACTIALPPHTLHAVQYSSIITCMTYQFTH